MHLRAPLTRDGSCGSLQPELTTFVFVLRRARLDAAAELEAVR